MPVPVAAIDIGSNSVRIAVMCVNEHHGLEVIEEARAVPRLIRDIEQHGEFRPETIEHLLDVLRDFRLIADAAGAHIVAVATSAARDASNGAELIARIHDELGFDLRVITGDEEARLAFLGAALSLPVTDGLVVDIGGGSMEIVRFVDRSFREAWTLPLGAVRLTDRFLKSDPPTGSELRALRAHITEEIRGAALPRLEADMVLVGTGGTIRNLGKIDRASEDYPLPRLHGYAIPGEELQRVVAALEVLSVDELRSISGLNEDRADTIVAGAIVAETVMEVLHASSLLVSGQGLREGMVLDVGGGTLPALGPLRAAALDGAVQRFAPSRVTTGHARRSVADALLTAVGVPHAAEFNEALAAAAFVMDLGRSVDYYNRERHTESLLVEHGLDGWSHRETAIICALIRQAHQEKYTPTAYRALLTSDDREQIPTGGCLLALADAITARRPVDKAEGLVWRREGARLYIHDQALVTWHPNGIAARFKRAFGIELRFEG